MCNTKGDQAVHKEKDCLGRRGKGPLSKFSLGARWWLILQWEKGGVRMAMEEMCG